MFYLQVFTGDDFEDMVLSRLRQAEERKRTGVPAEEETIEKPVVDDDSAPNAGERDFESLVMRKMRQAEERKRLIEQLENEDQG